MGNVSTESCQMHRAVRCRIVYSKRWRSLESHAMFIFGGCSSLQYICVSLRLYVISNWSSDVANREVCVESLCAIGHSHQWVT